MEREVILSTFLFYKERLKIEHLEFIKKAGFDAVEVFNYREHFDWRDASYIAGILNGFKKLGLRVHSFHAPWDPVFHYDIASRNQKIREKTLVEVFFLLKLLSNFGGKYFIIHPGVLENDGCEFSEDYITNAINSLKVIIVYARELGIEVLIENPQPPELGSCVNELEVIFNSLKDYRPKFCFDIGHAFISQDGIDKFIALGRCPLELHISDNHGERDEHLLPGEGRLPVEDVMDKLKKQFGEEFFKTVFNFEIGRNPGFEKLSRLVKLPFISK